MDSSLIKLRNSVRKGLKIPQPYRNSLLLNKAANSSSVFRRLLCSYLWRKLENRVKWLGSHSAHAKPAYLLAIPHYTTGIGHSVMELNTAVVRAQRWELKYLHVPLREPWEHFFSFGAGEAQYADIMARKPVIIDLPYVPLPDDPAQEERLTNLVARFRSETLVVFRLFPKTSVFAQSEGSAFLREKYMRRRAEAPAENLLDAGKINISIHIRRGDIMSMMAAGVGSWRERYVDLEYFVDLAKLIEEVCGSERVHFNIFSQGEQKEFEVFDCLSNVHYRLDYDVFASFHNLVMADIMICSPSSFSYLPSLFSDGIKVFRSPFWHDLPNRPEWILIDENVGVTERSIREKLAAALRQKELI